MDGRLMAQCYLDCAFLWLKRSAEAVVSAFGDNVSLFWSYTKSPDYCAMAVVGSDF
jgi:hypothetical protein